MILCVGVTWVAWGGRVGFAQDLMMVTRQVLLDILRTTIKTIFKNEDHLKNEDVLKNEDHCKNKDRLDNNINEKNYFQKIFCMNQLQGPFCE